VKPDAGKPRGILNPKASGKDFRYSRRFPSPDLDFFVEHYWSVYWDLRGQEPFLQETLPHPSVHLIFEEGRSRIVGVMQGKFSAFLEGKGQVFGVKFKPGAFYPYLKSPVSGLTDGVFSFMEIFGEDGKSLEEKVLSLDDELKKIELAENFLHERTPERDENLVVIGQVADLIIVDREITKVDDILLRLNLSKRTLQRMFKQYVGVSPKWMIKRYRLHEAAEQLAAGSVTDWPKMAQDCGYFDQAHFIKDFKSIVGKSPAEYAKIVAAGS